MTFVEIGQYFSFCQGLEEAASSQIWSESRGLREVS